MCSLCLQLLLCVWGVLKRLLLRQSGEWKGHADPASVAASQGATPQSEWVNEEWGESWEVKVVPNEEGESSSHSNQHSNRSHDNNDGVQSSDLFRDMTPVIKKATTVSVQSDYCQRLSSPSPQIQLKPALDQQQHKGSSSHRFSVESAFPSVRLFLCIVNAIECVCVCVCVCVCRLTMVSWVCCVRMVRGGRVCWRRRKET